MDSSDSEDDCYGNIAQKLQRMKNRYNEDKIESTNLLNDSAEINKIVKNTNKTTKIESKTSPKQKNNDDSAGIDAEDSVILDNIIATSKRRVTRSSSKRASSDTQITLASLPKKSKRRKKTADVPVSDSNSSLTEQTSQNVAQTSQNANQTGQNANQTTQNVNQPSGDVNPARGRGTSRGRGRGRGRNYWQSNWNIPIYSVGNTDEYPDQSDNQQLFSSKKPTNDVILIEEMETLDENEELSVKVYWQSSEFFKFTIRRFQKLSQIFDYFSKKENVSNDKLFFTYNDRILKPDDTPDSIDYRIVKFIDGGIVNQSFSNLTKNDSKEDRNGIIIKFQCQNVKKPYETRISLDDKLSIAMMKCAEHFETALDKLKFQFDGDSISGKNTALDLDLEGGECIDVKIVS